MNHAAAPLRAAIVGLGQVGSRCDEEPRPAIWSHAGAYMALPHDYILVAGADPAQAQRARFAQRVPNAKLFEDPVTMLAEIQPDVVSVCTHPHERGALIASLLTAWRPRVMICEKPLGLSHAERTAIIEGCARADVKLLVNYTRRYQAVFRAARQAIAGGVVGDLVSISIRAPNRLWSIGSHAINLLTYLAGESPRTWRVQPLPALYEAGEPAANVLFEFASGLAGILTTTGLRDLLLFEVDVLGKAGRLIVTDNGETALRTAFESSAQYQSYRVPGRPTTLARHNPLQSPFVALAEEAARAARSQLARPCDGQDAVASETIVEAIVNECTTPADKKEHEPGS